MLAVLVLVLLFGVLNLAVSCQIARMSRESDAAARKKIMAQIRAFSESHDKVTMADVVRIIRDEHD